MTKPVGRAADCHPDRPHIAHGLCDPCYRRRWRQENPEKYEDSQANRARATCHPDRPVSAKGLCNTCYRRSRRADPEYAEREREYHRKKQRERYAEDPEYRRRRKIVRYGISVETYDALLATQGGGCAVCSSVAPPDRPLQIDHDHTTGVVRGLLCGNCNSALGHARDDRARLLSLVAYLDRHSSAEGDSPGV